MTAKKTLTAARLKKFVARRNKSAFNSNLQFQIDARGCGIDLDDLGDVHPYESPEGGRCYRWTTPVGELHEVAGILEFRPAEKEDR